MLKSHANLIWLHLYRDVPVIPEVGSDKKFRQLNGSTLDVCTGFKDKFMYKSTTITFEPHPEKTCLRCFRPGQT